MKNHTATPLYTTSGDLGGFLVDEYLYDPTGDWIGFTSSDKPRTIASTNDSINAGTNANTNASTRMLVYSVWGNCVGWLSDDNRILCNRTLDYTQPKRIPPAVPARFIPPAQVPLPKMVAELRYEIMDLLEERPDLLPTLDAFAYDDEE